MPAKRAEAKPEVVDGASTAGPRRARPEAARRTPRHEALSLDADALVQMFQFVLLARAFDDRTSILVRQGKIPFTVPCTGHEAAQVGAAWTLRPGVDVVLPYYRDVGVMLVLGMTLEELMLNEFARATDPNSGGRQMPKHYSSRKLRVLSGSSPVATQIPHAAGAALASRLKGEDAVTWVSFGEGATSKGDFHEGVNFAAVHRLPVIFFCENNQYAISVPLSRQSGVPNVGDRAAAYGIPGVIVDGNDILAVYEASAAAMARARAGDGPTLIEAQTYRLAPHTSNDDDRRYRSREEVAAWRAKDPVARFRTYLVEQGILSEQDATAMWERAVRDVEQAAEVAERAPAPAPESAAQLVYAAPIGKDAEG